MQSNPKKEGNGEYSNKTDTQIPQTSGTTKTNAAAVRIQDAATATNCGYW
jgi:hypothetical protein